MGDNVDIEQSMAAIAVRDVDRAEEWWTRLLGREADTRPMDGLVEWHFDNGALQLVADADRAGGSLTTLQVRGLVADADQLRNRGIDLGDLSDTSAGAAFVTITDPDGNAVTIVDAT
jgi:glyoxylase I family protein